MLYRTDSRGTQNTRTLSTDIIFSNILWPDGEKHSSKNSADNKVWQITKGSHLAGQREQTTGKFVKDIHDQVMFEPKGAVMPQFFF